MNLILFEKFHYRVALDEVNVMQETWLKAAKQKGISCAFVVNRQGKIVWIGHPMNLTDAMIEKFFATLL